MKNKNYEVTIIYVDGNNQIQHETSYKLSKDIEKMMKDRNISKYKVIVSSTKAVIIDRW